MCKSVRYNLIAAVTEVKHRDENYSFILIHHMKLILRGINIGFCEITKVISDCISETERGGIL